MAFTPSPRVHDLLRNELAGVWIDRSRNEPHLWIIAKLPNNLIREIRVGAKADLRAWVVEVEGRLVAAFGLTAYDDAAAPRTFFGACRDDDQAADLRAVLAAGMFPLQFHNENFLPLLQADCSFDPELARPVLDLLSSVGYPAGDGLRLRGLALDLVDAALSGNTDARVRASCLIPLTFEDTLPLNVHVAGQTFFVDDKDEGGELERLALQAFEWLCPHGAFRGPQVMDGGKLREMCDVLALNRRPQFAEEGIFVVQSKVASAFAEGLKRKTWRRATSIEKNIEDGIGQLKGAIENLKAGVQVWRNDGTDIETDSPQPEGADLLPPLNLRERAKLAGTGILLISDMHEGVDWRWVGEELIKVFIKTRYLCQVMDLQEFGRLMTFSDRRPALFESNLYIRWEAMVKSKTAFVRGRMKPETVST